MPQGWREQLNAQIAATERAIRAREADLRRFANQAEAKGKEIYERSIRTGEQVLARTPAEIRELGVAALRGELPKVIGGKVVKEVVRQATTRKPASTSKSSGAPAATARPAARVAAPMPMERNLEGQLRAGLSGAVDEFSFGLADRGLAAADAIVEGGLTDLGKRYADNMEVKRAEDARDARDYAIERNVGKTVGLVAGLVATGPAGAAVKAGLRTVPGMAKVMKHAAKLPTNKLLRDAGVDPRGLATAAVAGGGLVGVAGQGIADVAAGRPGSAQDYGGAAIGGGFGGLAALRGGPAVSKAVFSGAVGGGATSVAQDALQGRTPSYERAVEAAHLGGVSAGILDGLGTHAAAALPSRMKGELGETLSKLKTLARGRLPGHKEGVDVGYGREARPDQVQRRGIFGELSEPDYLEAKMGPSTRLSWAQERLRRQNPDRFAIDAWQFRHAGRAAGLAGGPLGSQVTE